MMNIRKILARNLEELMRESPTLSTQQALSKKTGIAQSHIGRLLRLESDPTTEKVDALARAFGVSASELLDENFRKDQNSEVKDLSRTVGSLVQSGKISPEEIKAMIAMLKARG